ncbi:MAG: outer membrane beta-barrel domain-containing protein [Bdellovibrionales bacterium]|nr:outer membrane beta-barrel domain-containing protein [Bdellovibrionales bacterium]
MKLSKQILVVAMVAGLAGLAQAGIMDDFDSLGGNDALLEKAQALNPETKIEIVQSRIVKRHSRHEFYPEYGNILGGDTYLNTQYLAGNYQYHINPRWSVGLKYSHYLNELGSEGRNIISQFGYIPELDWPKQSYLGLINYYPMYGKFNFFGKSIIHFDFYFLAGYGNIELKNGETSALTGGAGVGFWLSQHLTSRFEIRVLNYTSERMAGAADMKLTVANLSLGYML